MIHRETVAVTLPPADWFYVQQILEHVRNMERETTTRLLVERTSWPGLTSGLSRLVTMLINAPTIAWDNGELDHAAPDVAEWAKKNDEPALQESALRLSRAARLLSALWGQTGV